MRTHIHYHNKYHIFLHILNYNSSISHRSNIQPIEKGCSIGVQVHLLYHRFAPFLFTPSVVCGLWFIVVWSLLRSHRLSHLLIVCMLLCMWLCICRFTYTQLQGFEGCPESFTPSEQVLLYGCTCSSSFIMLSIFSCISSIIS